MKDRFRFRAWDKKNNTYYNPLNIKVNGLTLTIKDNVGTFDMFAHDLELSSIVIEQCTGLKDKNGKLIYEGDILQSTDEWFHEKYKVKWDREFSQFTLIGINTINVSFGIIDPDSLEVIGNIHENPELLEESK
nr:YopX family protein [uncultured Ligilactobacillus sp.]